jgi:hypothetical protein
LVILPFVLLIAFLVLGWKNKNAFLLVSCFLAGVLVSVAPWLLHNYLISGQITFDAPFEYQVIASQYKYTGNLDLESVDLQGKSLFGILLTFALKDPKFVFGFIASHSFATQIGGLLALPLFEKYNGLFAPVNLYWMTWDGQLEWYNLALILVYLAIIALGLAAAWRRLRWVGLLPLAFALGYSLANGISRFSGWRYDFPADWISYFYFGLGAAEIFSVTVLLLGADSEKVFSPISPEVSSAPKWTQGLLLAGAFALIGAVPWMAEGFASPRYADQTPQKMVEELSDSPAVIKLGVDPSQIELFMVQPQSALQIGRVLYPRYFYRGIGLSSTHPWPAYVPRDFSRMGFLLLNQTRRDALFQSKEIPAPFRGGMDAIVLGCQHEDYIDVRLILFLKSGTAFLSSPLSEPCP